VRFQNSTSVIIYDGGRAPICRRQKLFYCESVKVHHFQKQLTVASAVLLRLLALRTTKYESHRQWAVIIIIHDEHDLTFLLRGKEITECYCVTTLLLFYSTGSISRPRRTYSKCSLGCVYDQIRGLWARERIT
jgi:hypothetical protein